MGQAARAAALAAVVMAGELRVVRVARVVMEMEGAVAEQLVVATVARAAAEDAAVALVVLVEWEGRVAMLGMMRVPKSTLRMCHALVHHQFLASTLQDTSPGSPDWARTRYNRGSLCTGAGCQAMLVVERVARVAMRVARVARVAEGAVRVARVAKVAERADATRMQSRRSERIP